MRGQRWGWPDGVLLVVVWVVVLAAAPAALAAGPMIRDINPSTGRSEN